MLKKEVVIENEDVDTYTLTGDVGNQSQEQVIDEVATNLNDLRDYSIARVGKDVK